MRKISIVLKNRLEKFLKKDGAQKANLPEEDFVVAIVFVIRSFPVIQSHKRGLKCRA